MANGNGKKNSKAKATALAVINEQEFAILKADVQTLPALIADNVGPDGISPFDLDRVKIPAGGGLAWEIPAIDGNDVEKEFDGVIIFHKSGRVYWSQGLDESGGGTPPDCSSDDCVTGVGEPGGDCGKCPFAQFGSDTKGGRGQACKQVKQIFVIRPDSLLPICLSLPPTSLAVARKYMLRLAGHAMPYYGVLTRFGLEKTSNSGGIEYSRVTMAVAERLSEPQVAAMKQISEALRPCLSQVRVSHEDYTTDEIPV